MSEYIVKTASGQVKGYLRNGIIEYLGIPYAEPPVGPLRFKRSVPKTPWEGVYDAKEYGPVPVQFEKGQEIGSEDCLTVNVKRPPEGDKLPVFVWIYGGGYNTGSASDSLYGGESFARDGIVYVSFQYRLNVLGFYDFTTYPGCEDFDSNCGLSDQILALQWVRDNIAAFGGDPERVTIAGESAGGASVVNMLAAPAVKGCFQQAIAESGLPNCVMTHQRARDNIDLFIEGMGWTEADLPKLRTIAPYELLKGNEYMSQRFQEQNPGMFLPGPVQDDLLPVRPIDAIRGGSAAGVKLIIGTNMHEGTMFVHPEGTVFGWMNNSISIAQFAIMFATPFFMKKFGKRAIYAVGMLLLTLGFLGFGLFGTSVPAMMFFNALKGCGLGMSGGMAMGLVADAITYGTLKSGIDAVGMGNAGTSAAQKLGLGLGMAVFGWVMSAAGFKGEYDIQGIPQPESVLTAIKFMYNWIPMIMCAIIFVIMAVGFNLERDLQKLRAEKGID